MRAFWKVFKIELKNLKRLEFLICMVFVFVLALVFFKIGIDNFKGMQEEKEIFQKYEKANIARVTNYDSYADIGHHLFFVSPPSVAFFSNSLKGASLISFVDVGEVTRIYWQAKGKHVFAERPTWDSGFSVILMLLGGILISYYGFSAYKHSNYLRSLSSIAGSAGVYWLIYFARVLIITIYITCLFLATLLIAFLNGIVATPELLLANLFLYLGVLFKMFLLFSSGILAGMIPRRPLGYIVLFLIYGTLAYGLPKALDLIYKNDVNSIESIYKVQNFSLKKLIDFEERIDRLKGKINTKNRNTPTWNNVAEDYWNGAFKDILDIENKLRTKCTKHLCRYRKMASLLPGTFYLSIADSASGSGYEAIIAFWKYTTRFKKKYGRFYLDKKFYTNETEVENFVKGPENVFKSKPGIPRYVLTGTLSSFGYIFVLSMFGQLAFRRNMWRITDEEKEILDKQNFEIDRSQVNAWITSGNSLSRFFSGLFNLKPYRYHSSESRVKINGKSWFEKEASDSSLYLCKPSDIPSNINIRDLISLILFMDGRSGKDVNRLIKDSPLNQSVDLKVSDLNEMQQANLFFFLARAINRKVNIVSDLTKHLDNDPVYDVMSELIDIANHGFVIYIAEDSIFPDKERKRPNSPIKDKSWFYRHQSTAELIKLNQNSHDSPVS